MRKVAFYGEISSKAISGKTANLVQNAYQTAP